MAGEIREGSAPNFCPPVEEGQVFVFEDEKGELLNLEFLGLVIDGDTRFGFFFPVDDENPALSSGAVVCLEVVEVDEDGQPAAFELVEDEGVAREAYKLFAEATKDLYRFE
jgi:hypothetical protein